MHFLVGVQTAAAFISQALDYERRCTVSAVTVQAHVCGWSMRLFLEEVAQATHYASLEAAANAPPLRSDAPEHELATIGEE